MLRLSKTLVLFLVSCSTVYGWSLFGSSEPTEPEGERGECVLWLPVTGADPLTFNLVPLVTAEGNTYDPDDLVATHESLPVGSYVRVTNIRSGQFVDVKIGGRPSVPVIGRMLELSKGAFEQVAHISEGSFSGLMTPVTRPPLSGGDFGAGYGQGGSSNYPPQQGGGSNYPPQQGGGSNYPPQQGGGSNYPPPQGGSNYYPPSQGGNINYPPQQGGSSYYPPSQEIPSSGYNNYNQRPGGQYSQPPYGSAGGYNKHPYVAQPDGQGYVSPQQQQGYPQSAGGYSSLGTQY